MWSHAQLFKNGQDGDIDDTLTRNDYAWRDGAVTTGIIHDRHHDWTVNGGAANQINPGNFDQDWTTSYGFDGLGQLSSATIADGRARAIAFTNDENGQIIRRDESGSIAGQSGNPHEVWYRYGGRQLGYSGNNGTGKVDTQASINERQAAAPGASSSGTFRGGGNVGSRYADFAQSYDPLNSYGQGSGSGAYTASAGETLSSIAQSIWGDANLWYKIAAANGLSGDAQLSEGQQLSLPSGVTRSSFNASSITPYDAGSAIGDTSPTTAKPPKSNKCATMGMLMLAVVAIAVTAIATAGVGSALTGASFSNALGAVTGGALTGFGTATTVLTGFGAAASAATGAAIGAAVSQGLGVATGIQSKFSFKGVALAALSAGLGQGVVGGVSAFGGTSTAANIGNAAVRGVVGSALSQGIGVATGLQSKFSFAGVAAAGVAAGVGAALGGRLPSLNDNGSAGNIASHLAVGGARLIASAATRSALEGSSFSRNITAGLPDVLAQTLVDSAVGAARRGGPSSRDTARELIERAALGRGLRPGSEEYQHFTNLRSPENRAFIADIRQIRSGGDIGLFERTLETNYRRLTGATEEQFIAAQRLFIGPVQNGDFSDNNFSSTVAAGDGVLPMSDVGAAIGPRETVSGQLTSNTLIGEIADSLTINAGGLVLNIGERANTAIDAVPGARTAIDVLDWGLWVAGGPVRAAISNVVSQFQQEASSRLESAFLGVGYSANSARSGGVGGPIIVEAVTVGFGAALRRQRGVPGTYRPDRVLPADRHGVAVPDSDLPHTQLGTRAGRRGNYTQAREWGYDEVGNLVPRRQIDFTDHGRPNTHPNPHQHRFVPNPTGGTPLRGPIEPLEYP